jgi:hypothetical protein
LSDTGGDDGEDSQSNRGSELRDSVEDGACEALCFWCKGVGDDEVCDCEDNYSKTLLINLLREDS